MVSHHLQHIFQPVVIYQYAPKSYLVNLQIRGYYFTIILRSSQIKNILAGVRVRICSFHMLYSFSVTHAGYF